MIIDIEKCIGCGACVRACPRGIIEQIIANPKGVEAKTLAEIQRYAKLFWLNNGPYNNLTARKFVLACTPQEFSALIRRDLVLWRRIVKEAGIKPET